MKHRIDSLLLTLLLVFLWSIASRGIEPSVSAASTQSSISITNGGVEIDFPEKITFKAHITSSVEIERVVLEYGVEKLTCGRVVAKAFPQFEPGKELDVSWTWEMLKSGAEPPGAEIWYRWRATDRSGKEGLSLTFKATWLDSKHAWQTVNQENLALHWYNGSDVLGTQLLFSASQSLDQLAASTGMSTEKKIHIYVYGSSADLHEAILYEPGWTGGQAYPAENVVILGMSPEDQAWGQRTIAHELTHVLVGHFTFSCLANVPAWLNEGLAVYGEGGPEPEWKRALERAIEDDSLISVRALSGGFSEHPGRADLSYAQSHSVVNYLIGKHGRDKLLTLFKEMRKGTPADGALQEVYGFGLDGLEDRWRASIGAKAQREGEIAPTHIPEPTPVPTYRPISGVPVAPTAGPTRTPVPRRATGRFGNEGVVAPTATTLAIVIVLVGLPAAYLFIRRRRRQ